MSWLPGHLWRPNGPPDYGIGEGERILVFYPRYKARHTPRAICILAVLSVVGHLKYYGVACRYTHHYSIGCQNDKIIACEAVRCQNGLCFPLP